MVRGECWERLYIYLLYRHPIYSLSLYIFYHFYYLEPKLLHLGIIFVLAITLGDMWVSK